MQAALSSPSLFDTHDMLSKLNRHQPQPLLSRQLAPSKATPSLPTEIATILSAAAQPEPVSKQQALDNFEQEIVAIEIETRLRSIRQPAIRPAEHFTNPYEQPFVVNPEDAPICVKQAMAHTSLTRREKVVEFLRDTVPFLRF